MSQNPTVYNVPRTVATEQAANIPVQMDKDLLLLDPNENPFTLLTTQIPKRKVGNDQYLYHDDEIVPEHSLLSGSSSAINAGSQGTWNVTAGQGEHFAPWDIVKNMATGSWGQVEVIANDALTVDAHVAILAGTSGDVIQRMGNAMEEGGGIPLAKSTAHTERTNFIQGFMDPIRMTDMAMKSDDYFGGMGKDYIRQHKKALLQHARNIEWAFLFNPAAVQATVTAEYVTPATESTTLGVTQGLENYIETNSPADNIRTEEDLTESEFYRWMEPCHEYGGSNKWLFASPVLFELMLEWNLGKIRFEASSKPQTLGMNFARVALPFGGAEVKLVNHKMCKAKAGSSYNYAFLVDFSEEKIKYVYFNGLDTRVLKDQVKTGLTQTVDMAYTRCGSQFRLAETHGMLKFKTPY